MLAIVIPQVLVRLCLTAILILKLLVLDDLRNGTKGSCRETRLSSGNERRGKKKKRKEKKEADSANAIRWP
jgi:hypothetical protein